MTEARRPLETESDRLKTAFTSFRNLAKQFGQRSEEGGYTLKKYIDNNSGLSDVLSGRDYGANSHTVEIFYGVGNEGHKIILTQDHLGTTTLTSVLFFQRREGTNFWAPKPHSSAMPDTVVLNKFLSEVQKKYIEEKQLATRKVKYGVGLRNDYREDLERKAKKRN